MEDGLLSLKWNNHKSTFFHILSSLRKKETYTDATLACEGKFFAVHKLVMSTCSDYFSEVFERTNCKSPVVILKDIKHHDLEALLDYMYLGEVDVKQSELAGLIKAAECLRIKGLAVPDEDPTLSQRKAPHVPEHRSSPAAKRIRRESGGGVGSDASSHHYANKNRKSLSPLRSHSSSALSSTSVPSQSVNSDTLSQVPSSLSMHPPSYSDTRHSDLSSSSDNHKHVNQSSLVPVDMIKVEVEDEGNSNNSQVRRTQDGPPDLKGGREESRGEGGEDSIGEGRRDKESLANNFSEYSGHTGEIEKEEHDQLDSFNGSDQIPGPSGVQGGSQMMNWGEEEGNFPHNLFGGDDSSHQQVKRKLSSSVSLNHTRDLKEIQNSFNSVQRSNIISVDICEANRSNESFEGFEADWSKDTFEGFETDQENLSKIKKNLIYEKWSKIMKGKRPVRADDDNSVNNVEEFQEYIPFEVLAQDFEDELRLIPFEVCLEEKNEVYHPPRVKSKHICYSCNRVFKAKKTLAVHLNNPNLCSFSCPVCPYKGKDLLDHIRFHADCSSNGKFYCLICKACVRSIEELSKHLKVDHTY